MTITFKHITKDYNEKSVLSDVSFDIASREFFVLVGASGGGKTTLLKMINRLIEPTSGEILIDNEKITSLNLRDLRLQIGYVLQQIALFPNMTVLENVGLIPAMKGWKKEQIRARVTELLPLVGLDAETYLDRLPSQLSGGEAQRIGILRAIAAEPKIILMDEPFSALDPISRKQLQELVKNLQKELKITTVFVTHDMNEAMALADHIAIVKEGNLLQTGTPQELLNAPADDYVASFFKDYQEDFSKIKLNDLTENLTELSKAFSADAPLTEVLKTLSHRHESEETHA
ncbi:ABC transporter ATP-binding protein [Lactococcus nasutitermitis]|uniref:ABC transporter ATP-binding protein n=1 Tax=Lactococcus nasutitermitis TaxID=1652957 RepID=A0ABV9JEY1_9LACT|nr:ABC transporter ATP-binding protein [Lactococcus nasutitermitis]